MDRQNVDQGIQPVLVQHGEAGQHQRARQHVRDIEAQTVCHMPPETNSSSTPSRLSISAAPRKLGTRNTRILAIDISNTPSSTPAAASFSRYASSPSTMPPDRPNGKKMQPITDT